MVHQPPPITRKLPEAIGLGERRWLAGAAPSPRGWKNRDADGVGLGIAVALEKAGSESPRKLHATTLIAIGSPRTDGPKGRPDMCGLGCSGRHSESLRSGERAQGGELRRKVGAGSFCLSPPPAVAEDFRVADFLSNCYLCRKKLDGKDIFMYREKAFCSMECRYRQIVTDEYQEKLGVETPKRSPEIASSPYSGGQLFFTGIVVS